MIYVRPQLNRKEESPFQSTVLLEFFSFLLTISNKVSKLAWMNMFMDLKKKCFIEFEGLWKLFSQMPHTFQELSEHRWNFLWVTIQMATPNPPESTSFWKCHWKRSTVRVLLNLNTYRPPPTAKKNRKTLLHWHLKKKTVMFLLKQFTPMSFSTTILTGLLHSNYYNADKMEGNKLLWKLTKVSDLKKMTEKELNRASYKKTPLSPPIKHGSSWRTGTFRYSKLVLLTLPSA